MACPFRSVFLFGRIATTRKSSQHSAPRYVTWRDVLIPGSGSGGFAPALYLISLCRGLFLCPSLCLCSPFSLLVPVYVSTIVYLSNLFDLTLSYRISSDLVFIHFVTSISQPSQSYPVLSYPIPFIHPSIYLSVYASTIYVFICSSIYILTIHRSTYRFI